MKIVVLGAGGMLGRRLLQLLPTFGHEVVGTVRAEVDGRRTSGGADAARIVGGVSAESEDAVQRVLDDERPDVVVNCIGVVKQLASAKDPLVSIPINALFPHRLAEQCGKRDARMIHFSTDCVFSGKAGPYTEASPPDPEDLYGRTKLIGEVNTPGSLTLRTSIIGHEPGDGTGLVSWVLRNKGGRVAGFARALYTGVTTDYMARAVDRLMTAFPDLSGVWHLSADAISKYDLICLMNEVYGLGLTVDRDESFVCDRRLDSSMLRRRTGITPPSWQAMLEEMHTHYEQSQVENEK